MEYISPKEQAGIDIGILQQVKRHRFEDIRSKIARLLEDRKPCFTGQLLGRNNVLLHVILANMNRHWIGGRTATVSIERLALVGSVSDSGALGACWCPFQVASEARTVLPRTGAC